MVADFIADKINAQVETAIILGSGLGKLADEIENPIVIPYAEIPLFGHSTVAGHKGNLIFGQLSGKNILAMQGRFHFYEGYNMKRITLPIRVFSLLGVKRLFVSNAAGGCNPDFQVGDLMLITDHINLMPNPLTGKNLDSFGVRFPDMTRAYDRNLMRIAEQAAEELHIQYKKGIYVGVTGASFETPAEYEFYRRIGGDAVGMSTVPEVIVARHCGMEVIGISVITNQAYNLSEDFENSHTDVMQAANQAADTLSIWVKRILEL
ncbi:MAG: purine nucleoside phosphorylase I, inosine and guanosine-specific [Lentimicrobiaceae bacterium]|nr:purine nucleoside phosphorylase I, inosine and guanosine-specific [Lentimicrobiaceae bacterium]